MRYRKYNTGKAHQFKINGVPVLKVDTNGLAELSSGAGVTIDGVTLKDGDVIPSAGVGAVNGSTVSAVEAGDGAVHKTVLTLTSAVVPITSTTTANGFGGLKVYDLPAGYIRLLGCTANLSIAVAAAEQDNFTDATPEGDIGVGSVIIANADALGTDATDDDYATGAAFVMDTFADASVVLPPEDAANFNGTSTAKDVNVNVLVDAADIDDDATTAVEVSGTITIVWSNLGDY